MLFRNSRQGPPPIKPPTPEPTKPATAADPNFRKKEKCRKTVIVRIWDDKCTYWIDVEMIVAATFKGSQWPGPDHGNQSQQTIKQLLKKLDIATL